MLPTRLIQFHDLSCALRFVLLHQILIYEHNQMLITICINCIALLRGKDQKSRQKNSLNR